MMKLKIELDNGTCIAVEHLSDSGLTDIVQAICNIQHFKAITGDTRPTGDVVARLAEAYTDEVREHAFEMCEQDNAPKRRRKNV